jgi:hypothetical protein
MQRAPLECQKQKVGSHQDWFVTSRPFFMAGGKLCLM